MAKLFLPRTHPILQMELPVQTVTEHFCVQHGFNYFQYFRCYADGSVALLVNNTSLLKHFIQLDFPSFSSFDESHQTQHRYWFLWDEGLPWLPVKIARDYHQLHHGLTYIRRTKDHYDMIAVAMSRECANPASYYLSKQKAIEQFITQFDQSAKGLIQEAENARLLLPEANRDRNYRKLCLQQHRIPVIGAYGESYLTPQELACLRLVVEGQSYKEVGRVLDISPRTVEVYLQRMKQRTGLIRRAELASLLC